MYKEWNWEINILYLVSVDVCWGWLDKFFWLPHCMGFTCQVVRGFSAFAPYLEHVHDGGGVVYQIPCFNGHDSVGNYTLPLDHSVLVRSDICQLGCHGESWAYVWRT